METEPLPSAQADDETAAAASEPSEALAEASEAREASEAPEPVDNLDEAVLAGRIEAVLFASDSALNAAKVAKAVGVKSKRAVAAAVEQLNARYDQTGSAFRIENIAGGYQMLTRPEFHEVVRQFYHQKADTKLTQAALETLAIVAYRQPAIRADIESIRGVACGEVLRGLMERQLVKIVGRAEILGRPMLYGTTRRFLEVFGLNSIEDLPNVEELRAAAPKKQTGPEQPPLLNLEGEKQDPNAGNMELGTGNEEQGARVSHPRISPPHRGGCRSSFRRPSSPRSPRPPISTPLWAAMSVAGPIPRRCRGLVLRGFRTPVRPRAR
ncbi:MAG: SMC-Scp complex subunit ScpB [Planctomycetota bacterium]|nr:SMC-Scp complex subunit ScpB [Planctomycetota bacterium]